MEVTAASSLPAQPYPGPAAFGQDQQKFFCGRKRETADICDLLSAHRVGILFSSSGAGKTSLVHAGIKPRMEEHGATVRPLRVSVYPKTANPSSAVNVFVANAVWSASQDSSWNPNARLSELVEERTGPFPAPQVLIFDQFEEIFTTFPESWKSRGDLFAQIAEVLKLEAVQVLLCIREEYLAAMQDYEGLLPDGFRLRYHLERLQADEALEAIETPAREAGVDFDPNVAKNLRDDLLREWVQTDRGRESVEGEFVEPLQLQVVCDQIWRTLPASATSISAAHVGSFGKTDDALRRYYDSTVHQVADTGAAGEERLRAWFEKNLITPGGTRGIVYRGRYFSNGVSNKAVEQLEAAHLIRGDTRAGSTWYELTHDRFIEPIKDSNRAWRRERGIRSNLDAWIGAPAAIVAVLAATALLLLALQAVWPAKAGAASSFLGFDIPLPFESRLLVLVAVSGALGSLLKASASLAVYLTTRATRSTWIWLSFARIPVAAGLALVCYSILRAALIPSLSVQALNTFGISAVSILIGFYSGDLVESLGMLADNLLQSAAFSRLAPAIFEASPPELHPSEEAVWVVLLGSGFTPGATALVDHHAKRTVYIDSNELRVLIEPSDFDSNSLSIYVESPPPANLVSNIFTIRIVGERQA
jgi:hypothetical protein